MSHIQHTAKTSFCYCLLSYFIFLKRVYKNNNGIRSELLEFIQVEHKIIFIQNKLEIEWFTRLTHLNEQLLTKTEST